jgi:hypothetical protein
LGATLSILLVGGAAHVAAGQPSPSETDAAVEELSTVLAQRIDRDAESARLAAKAREAFATRDLDAAMAALRAQIEIDDQNFVPHYNLACAHAAKRELDPAAAALTRAVELGFISRHQLERDPWLDNLRGTDFYARLVDNWPAVLLARREAQVEAAQRWLDRSIVRTPVPELRIDVLSAYDERSTEQAVEELRRVAAWSASVAPHLFAPHADDAWVVVVLPERREFLHWAIATFGPAARRSVAGIGGAYEHDQKRLVAQDLGATLRHEFFHVLHWRAMDRLGQTHPIWIQEGLASLVEDFDPAPASPAGIEPVASWRTNIVKRLGKANRLPGLDELAGLTHTRFSTSRPLARYAQARTLFLFLHDRDELAQWLGTYTGSAQHGFDADPSGLSAFDTVVGLERDRGERAYRAWVSTRLPEVAEEPTDVRAQLGVGLEPGDGDGPRVKVLPRGARRATGLRLGDVVTSVDSRATRSTQEYLRVISAYSPGQTVKVTYRRGKLHGETEITLIPVP